MVTCNQPRDFELVASHLLREAELLSQALDLSFCIKMGSCSDSANPVLGKWKNFVFKMIQVEDHPKILAHLKEHFLYPALYRIGYTRDMDDDMVGAFEDVLNGGYNLSFYAEEESTGKVAGCRIIKLEKSGTEGELAKSSFDLKDPVCRGFLQFYYGMVDECRIQEKFQVAEYPHMFGISVDPSFQRLGLATEIYKRAKALLKERGHSFAVVSFISPYSRAAAAHHGFVQLALKHLTEAKNAEGAVVYPEADPENFVDFGVFYLD